MSGITTRKLDPTIKERVRATERGQSMEAEARRILQTALGRSTTTPGRSLYERIHARLAPLGGVDLELPARAGARAAALRLMFPFDTNVPSAMMRAVRDRACLPGDGRAAAGGPTCRGLWRWARRHRGRCAWRKGKAA